MAKKPKGVELSDISATGYYSDGLATFHVNHLTKTAALIIRDTGEHWPQDYKGSINFMKQHGFTLKSTIS